jgi:hypothetical protein
MKENSQLHLEVIRLKEEVQRAGDKTRVAQVENELNDVLFLSGQKDKKIQEMERNLADMRVKL